MRKYSKGYLHGKHQADTHPIHPVVNHWIPPSYLLSWAKIDYGIGDHPTSTKRDFATNSA